MTTTTHTMRGGFCTECGELQEWLTSNGETMVPADDAAFAEIAEHVAVEVAWLGHVTEASIGRILASAGFDGQVSAAEIAACGVESGLLRPVPRLGGFTVSRDMNARVFGVAFADWMAAV